MFLRPENVAPTRRGGERRGVCPAAFLHRKAASLDAELHKPDGFGGKAAGRGKIVRTMIITPLGRRQTGTSSICVIDFGLMGAASLMAPTTLLSIAAIFRRCLEETMPMAPIRSVRCGEAERFKVS